MLIPSCYNHLFIPHSFFADSWTSENNPSDTVLKEIDAVIKKLRKGNIKKEAQKNAAEKGTFDHTEDITSAVKMEGDLISEEISLEDTTATRLDISQLTDNAVPATATDTSMIIEEVDEEEIVFDSISLDDFSIIMECDSELEDADAEPEGKNWEDDWPIESHDKFLEIQSKVEEDSDLKDILVGKEIKTVE